MTARRVHVLIGLVLAIVTTVSVLVNQRDVGIARDEVVYMQYGARYAAWWRGLVTFDHGISAKSITASWGGPEATDNNREHPPLMKELYGMSQWLLHDKLDLCDEITAARAPAAATHGLAVGLVYAFALELFGLTEAILAGVLLLLVPRALFHAGLACFDAPIMTWWLATVLAYYRALDPAKRYPWLVGVMFGFALATKHTAVLLPFALGAHYLWLGWRARLADPRLRWALLITHRWRVIASLAVIGPLVLFVLWPWLWLAPFTHVAQWMTFHLTHVHYNYEYLGHNWNAPRFPWHVAIVTTLLTVPVVTLAGAAIGFARWIGLRGTLPRAPLLLLVLSLAASIGPFLLGTTPIFGAEKHWMPALPTLCIAAAAGIAWAARALAAALVAWKPALPRATPHLAVAILGTAVAIAAATETITAQPYALTSYNALAGGAPGGADLGMNRQFWGVAVRGVLPVLAAEPPPTGPQPRFVYTHDASPAWGLYQKLGLVPKWLVDSGHEDAGVAHSDLALVVHELHFNRHDYMIWQGYRTVRPIYVLRSDGVPIVSVYERPK